MSVAGYYSMMAKKAVELPATYTNKLFWYDPTFGVSKDGSNRITEWGDRFGVNTPMVVRNLISGVTRIAPLHGDISVNSVPMVSYEAANKTWLTQQVTGSPLFARITTEMTMYMVVDLSGQPDDFSNVWGLLRASTSGTDGSIIMNTMNSPTTLRFICDMNEDGITGSEVQNVYNSESGIFVMAHVLDGTTSTHYINGVELVSGTLPTNNRIPQDYPLSLGARPKDDALYGNYDMGDFIMYKDVHSTTDITAISNYLKSKYAIS